MQRLFILLIFCAPVLAQSSFQVVSSLSKPGEPIRHDCLEQVAEVRHQIDRFPHPAKWTYVVACDDLQWPIILTRIGYVDSKQVELYALTDLQDQLSVFRGPALLSPATRKTPDTSEMIVARELAHIYLQTHDDEAAAKQASAWIKR